MKKIFICCFLIVNLNLFAQITISEPTNINKSRIGLSDNIDIGVRLGMNFMSLHYNDSPYYEGANYDQMIYPGLGLSLFTSTKISTHFKFIFELGIVQKKNKVSIDNSYYNDLYFRKTNQAFVSLGVLISPLSNFSINLSPYVGYSSKVKLKNIRESKDSGLVVSDDDFYVSESSSFEYGINLNLEYLIKEHYLVSVGYSRGRVDSNYQIDPINRGLTLSVAYLIN